VTVDMAEVKLLVSASMGVMNSLLGKLTMIMGKEYAKLKGVRKEVPDDDQMFSMHPCVPVCIYGDAISIFFCLFSS